MINIIVVARGYYLVLDGLRQPGGTGEEEHEEREV